MRALLRVNVVPNDICIDFYDKDNKKAYVEYICQLFERLGLAHHKIGRIEYVKKSYHNRFSLRNPCMAFRFKIKNCCNNSNSTEYEIKNPYHLKKYKDKIDAIIAKVFEDVPEDIKIQELNNLILFGYLSEGQAPFVVCTVNPGELHIRIQASKFSRIKKACEDIHKKAKLQEKKVKRNLLIKRIYPNLCNNSNGTPQSSTNSKSDNENEKIKATVKSEMKKNEAYLKLESIINIMEPHQHEATIKGTIIENSVIKGCQLKHTELVIATFMFISTIFTMMLHILLSLDNFYQLGSNLSQCICTQVHIQNLFTLENRIYIIESIDRLSTAFLVTFLSCAIQVILCIRSLKKNMPIVWDS